MFRALVLLGLLAGSAFAEEPAPLGQPIEPEDKKLKLSESLAYQVDPDAYSIISAVKGLSTHKPMYSFPLTWSKEYRDRQTEVVFQISAKQKLLELFGSNLYFGYSQKSFWQLYNQRDSAPFRSTDYNPELFYRWVPDPKQWHRWGMDVGFEHESNGQLFPDSRSWNRVYVAPFQAKGRQLAYLKFWYRIPEGRRSTATHQQGDDNPDLANYYGYSDFTYSRQIGGGQLVTATLRGNVRTGKGAGSLTWSVPSDSGYMFWAVSAFHGYGENLLDYDESTTRVLVGVMLAR